MLAHEQLVHRLLSLRVAIIIVLLQGHPSLRMLVELGDREMFIPIFWNSFAEDSKVYFEFSIDSFCLSIGFWMVCGTDLLIDSA